VVFLGFLSFDERCQWPSADIHAWPLPTRSRHCSCYEAVIQRLSKAATMRSRLERIV